MSFFTDFPAVLNGSLLVLVYLVFQLPLLLSAGLLARRFSPRNLFEYLAVAGILYTLFMTAIPGLLGLFGLFSFSASFLTAAICGGFVFVLERERPKLKLPPLKLTLPEFLLLVPLAGIIGYQWRAYGFLPTVGTDALMYHLYYPAEWLRTGWVERISQPGIMTASYPCYGELIYGWQMAGINSDFFAKNYQFYFLLLSFFCTAAAGIAAGIRRPAAIAAGVLVAVADIGLRNCSVGNTDVMTGAFLLSGVAFLIIGARRNSLGFFLLAGAGFGMCAGTKLLGTMLAPCAFLLGAAALWFLRPVCRRNLQYGILCAAVIASPCFIANWIVAGNPVFPARVGIGTWTLFANYMVTDSPAVGFSRAGWSFFVNPESNSLSLRGTILMLICFAGAFFTLLFRKRSFGKYALLVPAVMIPLLLAVQLAIYPAMTQARAIIPLVMLTCFSSLALLDCLAKRLPAPVFTLLLFAAAYGISSGRFSYAIHWKGILLVLAYAVPLLWLFLICRGRKIRIAAAAFTLVLLVLDGGFRYGTCNNVSFRTRRDFLGDPCEDAREILMKAAQESGPLRIVYCGAYYFNYIGNTWENVLLSPPVTESGGEHNWNYRTLAEARIPGPYSIWLDRVRNAGAQYLLVDTNTFHAPNETVELEWALAHPEHFRVIYRKNEISLFQFREAF